MDFSPRTGVEPVTSGLEGQRYVQAKLPGHIYSLNRFNNVINFIYSIKIPGLKGKDFLALFNGS